MFRRPSLMPEYHMRNSVFGSAQSANSGALLNGIAADSANFQWGKQWYYNEGTHTPIRFTFWNLNDIVDQSGNLNGVVSGVKRIEIPFTFAGSLRQMIEDAVDLIDNIKKRSQQGTIDIMYVGGDST
eukprot:9489529-Pyramimonas_sp.AAC.1